MKLILIIFFILINHHSIHADDVKIDQNKIFKNIRCLICQGQSVADSNSEFAQTIKLVVRDQIKKGKSEKEIYSFLNEKYGEWILYNPALSKTNFLLWSLPYLVFLIGGLIIFSIVRKNKQN